MKEEILMKDGEKIAKMAINKTKSVKRIKSYLTIDKQIEHLKQEGMIIRNAKFAKNVLTEVNFYHLKGYWYNQCINHTFQEGVTFQEIYNLYKFDSELRHMIISLLECLEVKLKSYLIDYIAGNWGALGYVNLDNFYESFRSYQIDLLQKINQKIQQNNEKPVIYHHIKFYGGNIPIWALMEILSFSDVSKLYSNLDLKDTKKIIKTHYNTREVISNLPSVRKWIRTLCDVRNMCAHYDRLYNHTLVHPVKLPEKYKDYNGVNNQLFGALIVLKLLIDDEKMMVDLSKKIESNIRKYKFKNLNSIGFPEEWKTILTE